METSSIETPLGTIWKAVPPISKLFLSHFKIKSHQWQTQRCDHPREQTWGSDCLGYWSSYWELISPAADYEWKFQKSRNLTLDLCKPIFFFTTFYGKSPSQITKTWGTTHLYTKSPSNLAKLIQISPTWISLKFSGSHFPSNSLPKRGVLGRVMWGRELIWPEVMVSSLYWLFNRGPYNGFFYNPHQTG